MSDKKAVLAFHEKNAADSGYHICPDEGLLDDLIQGLADNEDRYGYGSCPCRIACGIKTYDADMICPCEYRDADVNEFGMCYCGLYVSKEVRDDPAGLGPIPERRPDEVVEAGEQARRRADRGEVVEPEAASAPGAAAKPSRKPGPDNIRVWRCTVCGYLAARERPPPLCPICKAKADRFEPFEFR
ncbi:MAG: ferredoxin-thioredoxin reductase catalytic domain-containing protein [Pseudomonadota bacterium]